MNNMFGFDQNAILPYSKTKGYRRDKKVAENFNNLTEELNMKKEYEKSSKEIERKMLQEDTAKNLVNQRSSQRRRLNSQNGKLQESLSQKLLVNYLTEMTLDGLVFDEDFRFQQEDHLREQFDNFFTEAFEKGLISESSFVNSKNDFIQDAYFELQECLKNFIESKDNVDIFNEDNLRMLLSEAPKSKDLAKEIAGNVKDKVTDTIEKEKKISKKKEDEKGEDDADKADAAASLDKDVDQVSGDDATDTSDDDLSPDTEDSDTEVEDDTEDEPITDDDTEDDTEEIPLDDDSDDDDDDDSDDDDDDDDDDSDGDLEDDTEEIPLDGETAPEDEPKKPTGKITLTVETNGSSVSVTANKSESMEYMNIFGSSRYAERNSKSIFRNLLENSLRESAKILTESASDTHTVNMDMVLAEAIVEYTLLETMYTSRILDITPSQIRSLNKALNFKRK